MLRLTVVAAVALFTTSVAAEEIDSKAIIQEALSAAPPEIAANAAVQDWKGNTLRGGYDDWICYPTPPGNGDAKCPMCLDATWRDFVKARASGAEFKTDSMGLAYMLAGDCPVSNADPNADSPTADNQWINAEGPHLMMIVPDHALLGGMSTDPYSGRPYVMWKGTSYAHVMVPTAGKPVKHGMGSMKHLGSGHHGMGRMMHGSGHQGSYSSGPMMHMGGADGMEAPMQEQKK